MAALEILALNEATPQILAPGTGDTYTAPRKLAIAPEANSSALAVTGYSLTGSDTSAMLDLAGTWNTTGIANGLVLDVTNTASATHSKVFSFRIGGTEHFGMANDGRLRIGAVTAASQHMLYFTGTSTSSSILAVARYGTWPAVLLGAESSAANSGLIVRSDSMLGFSSSNTPGDGAFTAADVVLRRDAANTLALRNGTNVQTASWYGTYASSTDYHRGSLKAAKSTASAVSGASVTLSSLIPDGAVVIGVTTKVTTGLGTGNGTTGYNVGDGTDADRWGAITGTASGTSSDNTNATAGTIQMFTAANDVVLTAVGGNFDGTGAIEVCVFYLIANAD